MFTSGRQRHRGAARSAGRLASSSEQHHCQQPADSSSDTSVYSSGAAAAAAETAYAVTEGASSRVVCTCCGSVWPTVGSLRVHHVAAHDGTPFVGPCQQGARRRLPVDESATRPRRSGCSEPSSTVGCREDSGGPDGASSQENVVSSTTCDPSGTSDGEISLSSDEAGSEGRQEQFSTELDFGAHMGGPCSAEMREGFTYYNKDIEPIHSIGHTYVPAGGTDKISLLDFSEVVNIQPYVLVRDCNRPS